MNGKITEKIPYGFMRHEKYDVVVMDREKMESVKLMFNLYLDGMSLGQIKNVIESQGIEYPAKYKKDMIVGWSLAEIRKILSDPIYGNERYNAKGVWQFFGGEVGINQRADIFVLYVRKE